MSVPATPSLPEPALRYAPTGELVAVDGTLHPRVAWTSPLERAVAAATESPRRARALAVLADAHLPHLGEHPSAAAVSGWIADHALFLAGGAALLDDAPAAVRAFAAESGDGLRRMLDAARASQVAPPGPMDRGRTPRIAVLCSDHGGGNQSAAAGLAAGLAAAGYAAPLLNIHTDVIGGGDPLYRALGVMETDVWNRLRADRDDAAAAARFHALLGALHDHLPARGAEAVADAVEALRADAVVSCIAGYTKLVQIADRGIPTAVLHTDHCLNRKLLGENPFGTFAQSTVGGVSLLRLADPARLRVWLASPDPEPDHERIRRGTRWDHVARVIGYPLRPEFARATDAAALEALAASLGVEPDERVVVMMMGRDGMGDLLLRLVAALDAAGGVPGERLRVAVFCGRSERMRSALHAMLAPRDGARRRAGRLRFGVEGDAPPARVAAWLKLASRFRSGRAGAVVSKPGGATTAECAAVGAYLVGFVGLPWEGPNLEFAVRHGFGEPGREDGFPGQLAAVLARASADDAPPYAPVDWRPRAAGGVEELLGLRPSLPL